MPETPGSNAASERLEARVTPEQKDLFREAADLEGVTLTDFIVSSVHRAAIRTLEARNILDLSRRDQKTFVNALLHPNAPNRRLRIAWSRHAALDEASSSSVGRGRPRRAR